MKKRILLLGGIVLLGLLIWFVRGRLNRPAQSETISAGEPKAAAVEPVRRIVAASGRIEPISEEVAVGAEIAGRLVDLLVEEGGQVRRGAVPVSYTHLTLPTNREV